MFGLSYLQGFRSQAFSGVTFEFYTCYIDAVLTLHQAVGSAECDYRLEYRFVVGKLNITIDAYFFSLRSKIDETIFFKSADLLASSLAKLTIDSRSK